MKVIERVEQLKAELRELCEEYCENCQEFLCEECRREWRGEEDVGIPWNNPQSWFLDTEIPGQMDIFDFIIETLPSVQPNLQNQLATDCISRQDVLDALKAIPDHNDGMVFETLSHALRDIELLPSTQPERKVGKWNWDFADNGWADWTCSICGWKKNTDIHVNLGYNYCPNCGARMKEVTE